MGDFGFWVLVLLRISLWGWLEGGKAYFFLGIRGIMGNKVNSFFFFVSLVPLSPLVLQKWLSRALFVVVINPCVLSADRVIWFFVSYIFHSYPPAASQPYNVFSLAQMVRRWTAVFKLGGYLVIYITYDFYQNYESYENKAYSTIYNIFQSFWLYDIVGC